MMPALQIPLCASCKRYRSYDNEHATAWCAAFPDGIPQAILDGEDHRYPIKGDHGLQWILAPGEEDLLGLYETMTAQAERDQSVRVRKPVRRQHKSSVPMLTKDDDDGWEDEPRNSRGEWTSGGSSGNAKSTGLGDKQPLSSDGTHDIPSYNDLAAMQTIHGPLGSNAGQWKTDGQGNTYLLKHMSAKHAANEVAAGAVYHAAGIKFPTTAMVQDDTGNHYVVSKKIDNLTRKSSHEWRSDPKLQAKAAKDFGTDALLSHWDVHGLDADNTLVDQDGNPVRIEAGGAMGYRAQGAHKDSFAPDKTWTEPQSMRVSRQAKTMYGDMDDTAAADSLDRAGKINLNHVERQWRMMGLRPSVFQPWLRTLRARQDQIPAITAKLRGDAPDTTPQVKVAGLPSHPQVDGDKTHEYLSRDLHSEGKFTNGQTRHRYGSVMFDKDGKVLMVEPKNHFGGYAWTFPKGGKAPGEHPAHAAMRETLEESGLTGGIIGHLHGGYPTDLSTTHYYVMQHSGKSHPERMNNETQTVKWATPEEAHDLIMQTPNVPGRERDLRVLANAVQTYHAIKASRATDIADDLSDSSTKIASSDSIVYAFLAKDEDDAWENEPRNSRGEWTTGGSSTSAKPIGPPPSTLRTPSSTAWSGDVSWAHQSTAWQSAKPSSSPPAPLSPVPASQTEHDDATTAAPETSATQSDDQSAPAALPPLSSLTTAKRVHIAMQLSDQAKRHNATLPRATHDMTTNDIRQRSNLVGATLDNAAKTGYTTSDIFDHVKDKPGAYTKSRIAEQNQHVMQPWRDSMNKADSGRKAIIASGLSGSGKSTLLSQYSDLLGITKHDDGSSSHVTINSDDNKERLLNGSMRRLDVPNLSPMETAGLVHSESSDLSARQFAEAMRSGKNMVLDTTLGDDAHNTLENYIKPLKDAGYDITVVGLSTSIDDAKQSAVERWAKDQNAYQRNGTGLGGRFVPLANIEKQRLPGHGLGPGKESRPQANLWEVAKSGTVDRTILFDRHGAANNQAQLVYDSAKADKIPSKMPQSIQDAQEAMHQAWLHEAALNKTELSTAAKLASQTGGFTYDPTQVRFMEVGKDSGYLVGIADRTVQADGKQFMTNSAYRHKVLKQFIAKNRDYYRPGSHMAVGGWMDGDQLSLDPVMIFQNRDEAIQAGKDNDQKAIFDMSQGEEIDTGGSGGEIQSVAADGTTQTDNTDHVNNTNGIVETKQPSHSLDTSWASKPPDGIDGYVDQKTFDAARAKAYDKVRNAPTPSKEQVQRNQIMMAQSKRPGGDFRGNTHDRAVRTQSLLKEFGDGEQAPCVYCGKVLDKTTLTQDKIYTADEGGRYRMANLLPSCLGCNQARSDKSLFDVA